MYKDFNKMYKDLNKMYKYLLIQVSPIKGTQYEKKT